MERPRTGEAVGWDQGVQGSGMEGDTGGHGGVAEVLVWGIDNCSGGSSGAGEVEALQVGLRILQYGGVQGPWS